MDSLRQVISKFEYENMKKEFSRHLANLYRQMRRKERKVFYHIGYRNMAEDGFCYEFYKNIAFHTDVHRNTISKYVNFFIENKLLERKIMKAKYRYRKGLVLTKLGLCFYIFINRLNIYLYNKFKENKNYKEIDFYDFIYKFILNIFYLFNNILGSMHNEMPKVSNFDSGKCGNLGLEGRDLVFGDLNLGFKELKKPPSYNEHQKIWEKKREQFIKLYRAGFKLSEDIIKEYKLDKQ